MSDTIDRELDWDGSIQNDSPDFVLLPEGEYDFEVTDFERSRYGGGAKLPPCNMAILTVKIEAPEGMTSIKHRLYLHTKTEGLLCSFFTAIGQRKHGERMQMDWSKVKGAHGRCKLGIHEWISEKTGEKMQGNEIKRFLEPVETPKKAFTPGDF